MSEPLLATKLHLPASRPVAVARPRLSRRLDDCLVHKLTLISAPAGFGKTTLMTEWIAARGSRAAWLSLDEGDAHPGRFLAYLVAALRTIAPDIGEGIPAALPSTQTTPTLSMLTCLLNEIDAIPEDIVVALDDYHLVEAQPVDDMLAFLLDHLPKRMHLVVGTREDPRLPLPRLRARGELSELRAADLRFTPDETTVFLNQIMGLGLGAEDITAIETRTEGWIAGLQLAALSMRGHGDASAFIRAFTGSHTFVLDYLVEEVLDRQTEETQAFLLRTSILSRLCGPLCDALLSGAGVPGQTTLERLERANLFLVPLDGERRWYRYHHLFQDLLRQRLEREAVLTAELHGRASQWYEANGFVLESFHHAAQTRDIERAERLIEGSGVPLYFRGEMAPVLQWLGSLPAATLDTRPSLWVAYASALMMSGKPGAVEPKLKAAETALASAAPDGCRRDLVGRIAAMRALVAASRGETDTMVAQSHRALEHLEPGNVSVRAVTALTLGIAHQLRGDRATAAAVFAETLKLARSAGNLMITSASASSLGQVQESQNELHEAAETYRCFLSTVADPSHMAGAEAHFGLARIHYQWNDLAAAEQHARQAARRAEQLECDTTVACEVLLARIELARGNTAGATTRLTRAAESARQRSFAAQLPSIAEARILALLRQGNPAAADRLARSHDIPLSRARVLLAQGEAAAALEVIEPVQVRVGELRWRDEQLRALVLKTLCLHALGESGRALEHLADSLSLAQPGGLIRLFVDEGPRMGVLLCEAASKGTLPEHGDKVLAAFEAEAALDAGTGPGPLVDPLSRREIEVLRLVAQGLSNQEIAEKLFVSLSTVKGHNLRIFDKLQVQRRTEAIARAREMGLLRPGP